MLPAADFGSLRTCAAQRVEVVGGVKTSPTSILVFGAGVWDQSMMTEEGTRRAEASSEPVFRPSFSIWQLSLCLISSLVSATIFVPASEALPQRYREYSSALPPFTHVPNDMKNIYFLSDAHLGPLAMEHHRRIT